MPNLTNATWPVAQKIQEMLMDPELGLTEVYYGDQTKIPTTPCAAVETGPQTSLRAGEPFRLAHDLTIYIILYLFKVQSPQITRLETDKLAAKVVKKLHSNPRMDGLVIQGWVSRQEPGYAVRSKELMQAVRLTWSGESKTSPVMEG